MVLIECKLQNIKISDPFWSKWIDTNQNVAIFHQWEMLEKVGSIDNFRLVAKLKEGFRKGYFYTDSDVYKWAEAAAWILSKNPSNQGLEEKLNELIDIIVKSQQENGYIFTYNQFHFPGRMWANLSIEHELYCMGHLIEAGIAHYIIDKDSKLFSCARKAADLIVNEFLGQNFPGTPGHPEIEWALLKLYKFTQNSKYLQMAERFILRRGTTKLYGIKLLQQNFDQNKREKIVTENRMKYQKDLSLNHNVEDCESQEEFGFLETMEKNERRKYFFRALYQFFSGKYFQENKPFGKRIRPEGHAVRFGYFQTAVTNYLNLKQDLPSLSTIEQCWDKMISQFMYVTGGLGALPLIEGFGRPFELPNDSAYCETCAAVANILWTWELFKITQRVEMLDVLELQLYNAMLVGMGINGKSYLYRNILESKGNYSRRSWYKTPCCPSNISRILAQLGKFCYTIAPNKLFLTQYIGNSAEIFLPMNSAEKSRDNFQISETLLIKIKVEADLVDKGKIRIQLQLPHPTKFTLMLRIPHWSHEFSVSMNGKKIEADKINNFPFQPEKNSFLGEYIASGIKLHRSHWFPITRLWDKNCEISLQLSLPVKILKSHPKVKANIGRIAFQRGPFIFCSESLDNPFMEFESIYLPANPKINYEHNLELMGGIPSLLTFDKKNRKIRLIPYYSWSNRGPSIMQVWMKQSRN
ncbi:MAG: glycoside hydrolase family 127 protein [Promethearchaeota archaeon]